jgi:hypothetical protein
MPNENKDIKTGQQGGQGGQGGQKAPQSNPGEQQPPKSPQKRDDDDRDIDRDRDRTGKPGDEHRRGGSTDTEREEMP